MLYMARYRAREVAEAAFVAVLVRSERPIKAVVAVVQRVRDR